jgi:hypothetical protein
MFFYSSMSMKTIKAAKDSSLKIFAFEEEQKLFVLCQFWEQDGNIKIATAIKGSGIIRKLVA